MKLIHGYLIGSLLLSSSATWADEASDTNALITSLGAYLGYDLTVATQNPVSVLLNLSNSALINQSAFITALGAIPVNTYTAAFSQFVPTSGTPYSLLNQISNFTYTTASGNPANYNSASNASSNTITVSALLDQPTYQNDPISQAVLNILTTPDATYCMNNDATAWLSDCSYLYNTQVNTNVLGTIPAPQAFFTFTYNQPVVPQLNANSLLGPLLYDVSAATQSGSSSSQTNTTGSPGLTANNSLQAAANFIRYASINGVDPIRLPSQKTYSTLYATATTTDPSVSIASISNAQASLSSYISNLRSFAAQMSVPLSNLYASLSKRMPQQQGNTNTNKTSQALSEFTMATQRLFTPSGNANNQWINQINNASAATVQKEIAILLAEINYQLYLNRQLEERQLITSSLTLIQDLNKNAPTLSNSVDAKAP